MKVRLYSDLHREFDGWEIPVIDNEQDYTLVLAGDIAVAGKRNTYGDFLLDAADRHRDVVYIPGNHEYYGDSFDRAWSKIKGWFFNYGTQNLHFLQSGATVVVDDVVIVGATLWTDMDQQDPRVIQAASVCMNDYRAISRLSQTDTDDGWAYRGKLQPHHTIAEHIYHREQIDNALYMANLAGFKSLVVTHHGPTWQSVSPRYAGDRLNAAYVSDLSELIRERAPTAWVHGHVHDSMLYWEDNTLVAANPKGYPVKLAWGIDGDGGREYENPGFREDGLVPELVGLFNDREDDPLQCDYGGWGGPKC